jgi:ABC-type sugar transport system substrate-binding protein
MTRDRGWLLIALLAAVVAMPIGAMAADEPPANPYFDVGAEPGSGIGKRIGYLSLSEGEPFVRLVTQGIVEEAAVAGVDLLVCDTKLDLGEAVLCAQQLAASDVQGVLNFQSYEPGAPDVCAAYGELPTIAIDIRQEPCEVAFAGVDNRRAGLLVGTAIGEHLRRTLDCAYDSVMVLDASAAGATTRDRMASTLDGLESVCGPIPDDRLRRIDVYGTSFGDEVSRHGFDQSLPAAGTSSWRSATTPLSVRSERRVRSVVTMSSSSAARAPIHRAGRRSLATRSGSPTSHTSPSATGRRSSRR